MNEEESEAIEYLEYNVFRAYCEEGKNPVYMHTLFF